MEESKIGILGVGWLGLPLAKQLRKKGYKIKGSTTSAEKLEFLSSEGIEAFELVVTAEGITGEARRFLQGLDILLIDFPPGLRKEPRKKYSEGIKKLAALLEESGVKKLIFVSSISVYAETADFRIYSEDSEPNADSAAGKELAAAEKILQKNTFFETTVLRFGGLIGAGRHPVKYLTGRKSLENPLGPVNLIHQKDCIAIIENLIEKDVFGMVYNAVYPLNPPREKYYVARAREMGLEPPVFDHSKPSVGKIISASKLISQLGHEFVAPIQ